MTNRREDEVRKWGMTGRHCCDGGREGGTSQLDPSLKWATSRGGKLGRKGLIQGNTNKLLFTGIRGGLGEGLTLHSVLTKCMCLRFQLFAVLCYLSISIRGSMGAVK